MISKATGNRFGVSKRTPLAVLKSSFFLADLLWVFETLVNDLGAYPAMRAVMLIAFSSANRVVIGTNFIPQPWRRVRTLMLEATARNAVFVVASGNGRNGEEHRFVRGYPAYFAHPQTGSVPLTLVGAVDNEGIETPFSQQSSYISAWAPGFNAKCASRLGSAVMNGTSISAAMVAGLAAYFLGFANPPFEIGGGRTASNFNKYLRETASWRRSPEGVPRVIWNLQDGSSIQPLLNVSSTPAAPDITSS